MYKITTLCNLAVYWNPTSVSLESLARTNPLSWQATMISLIYREDNRLDRSHLQYILLPPTLITVKLSHNENLVGKLADEAAAASVPLGVNPRGVGVPQTNKGSGGAGVPRGSIEESKLPCLADVVVDIGHLSFHLDHTQLSQLIAILDAFSGVQRQRHLFLFRPSERPTKVSTTPSSLTSHPHSSLLTLLLTSLTPILIQFNFCSQFTN